MKHGAPLWPNKKKVELEYVYNHGLRLKPFCEKWGTSRRAAQAKAQVMGLTHARYFSRAVKQTADGPVYQAKQLQPWPEHGRFDAPGMEVRFKR